MRWTLTGTNTDSDVAGSGCGYEQWQNNSEWFIENSQGQFGSAEYRARLSGNSASISSPSDFVALQRMARIKRVEPGDRV